MASFCRTPILSCRLTSNLKGTAGGPTISHLGSRWQARHRWTAAPSISHRIFMVQVRKGNSCRDCGGLDHPTTACSWGRGVNVAQPASTGVSSTLGLPLASHPHLSAPPVCMSWNSEACKFPNTCNFCYVLVISVWQEALGYCLPHEFLQEVPMDKPPCTPISTLNHRWVLALSHYPERGHQLLTG